LITSWVTLAIFVSYLVVTILLGLWQARRVKSSRDFAITKMSVWRAATFLAGFTLGGASTYGIAGDTVKFGMTYLVWFPFSVAVGWWLTGLLFARPYYRMQGITLPTLLSGRFDSKTRLATSISTMLYALFVVLLEIYALATVIQAVMPGLGYEGAVAVSFLVSIGSVAFSGMLGSSAANQMHSGVMFVTFTLTLIVLWRTVGGLQVALDEVVVLLPQVAGQGIGRQTWLSVTGLGWGVIGQLILGKGGRLGGVSIVSNIAASCRSEKEAVRAFLLAGCVSGIPPFLAGLVGIFTAALLGPAISELPAYSSIGLAVIETSSVLAGFLLAAVAAAILSSFGPIAILLSTVLIEDLIKPVLAVSERQLRWLYPAVIIVIPLLCAVYVGTMGITDILPFVYKTAFPTMIPPTLVALFGIYSARANEKHALWAITLGVPTALAWGLIFNEPWGIHNIYISLLVPLVILGAGALFSAPEEKGVTWLRELNTERAARDEEFDLLETSRVTGR
jgi:SSS family solute:Na+ symporter